MVNKLEQTLFRLGLMYRKANRKSQKLSPLQKTEECRPSVFSLLIDYFTTRISLIPHTSATVLCGGGLGWEGDMAGKEKVSYVI